MFQPSNPITLKIKGLSLAQEARIIRRIEKRLKQGKLLHVSDDKNNVRHYKYENGLTHGKWAHVRRAQFNEIQPHRRFEIRAEARATHLARMFLKGKSYQLAEPGAYASNLIEQFPPKGNEGSFDRLMHRISDIAENFYVGNKTDLAHAFEVWKIAAFDWYTNHEPEKKPRRTDSGNTQGGADGSS